MVAFESSLAHLLNGTIRSGLVNEMLCCTFFMGVVKIGCVFPSVLWSRRFIQTLSLAAGFSNTLPFFLNKHWPFHNGGFSVSIWSLNGSAGHIVFFVFMYKGPSFRVTYLLIPLLLGYYSTKAIFFS
jgi:hypothetical protein